MDIDILQIGSHIGNTDNDHVFNKITEGLNVILIEPMPDLFRKLVLNYNKKTAKNNIHFLNIAVSICDGSLDLYSSKLSPPPRKYVWSSRFKQEYIEQPMWVDQLASVNRNHIEAHIFNGPTTKTSVPCKTLNTIIREHNIVSIENLYTDTEGHDYDILMSLNLDILKPTNIIFENMHTDGPWLKGKKYLILLDKFKSNGYTVVEETNTDTHVSLL